MVRGYRNCLFRAVLAAMHFNDEAPSHLRSATILEMRAKYGTWKDSLEYQETKFEDYINRMSRLGEWGTFSEIKVLSDLLDVEFVIRMNDKDRKRQSTQIVSTRKGQLTSCLEYNYSDLHPGINHFNGVILENDPRAPEKEKRVRELLEKTQEKIEAETEKTVASQKLNVRVDYFREVHVPAKTGRHNAESWFLIN